MRRAKPCTLWRAASGLRPRHHAAARQLVDLIAERAHRLLGWQLGAHRSRRLEQMLARKCASLPLQYDGWHRALRHARPRILMVGAGCYGPAAAMIAAAKDAGIVTAEYQHGAVSGGHDAYNFAPAVCSDPAYLRTLPDFFLGYGSWWMEQFTAPMHKVVIGNPTPGRAGSPHSARKQWFKRTPCSC